MLDEVSNLLFFIYEISLIVENSKSFVRSYFLQNEDYDLGIMKLLVLGSNLATKNFYF